MSETKWTKEQYAAITTKDCNLLVAAAAGAGKTAVLVERIIQKIVDQKKPIDIDQLLVVTFTNAAATEMRERIGMAISKAIEDNRDSKNIQRQLALLNKAEITTIHSFCLEVIRSNFQSINIDPQFRILDETEATLLKAEILNELFEEIYDEEENNLDFFELLEAYGNNRDDEKLQTMVLDIYSFVQSYPWPEQWLNSQVEMCNVVGDLDFTNTSWGRFLIESVKIRLDGLIELIDSACGKLRFALGLEKYHPVFMNDLSTLQGLSKIFTSKWNDIYYYLQNIEFDTLPRSGKDADKQLQEEVKKDRDELKAFIKNLKEEIFFLKSEEIIVDLKAMYPILKCITRLVIDFSERYSARKNQRTAVDFNDLEHFCLKILSEVDEQGQIKPTKVAKNYKDKFIEILVDEYQDSNLVQELIINLISRDDSGSPNVFMVGDVKQSIYRFRQAKPELFLDKYNTYSNDDSSLYRKILLFKNFRSRKEVVEGINFIFKQVMSKSIGELDYTEIEELNPGAAYPENLDEDKFVGGSIELHLIETSTNPDEIETDEEEESEEEQEEILDKLQKEARIVANRIIQLFKPDEHGKKFSVFDKKLNGYRAVQYRDIVILLRTTKNWTDVFEEELARLSIPTFSDTGSGFFKTPEVQVVLSLLQIIDNPYQDIPLLSVLRSPIVGFSTNELAELRLAERTATLFDALNILALGQTEASYKSKVFLERLEQWRKISVYISTHKLIWQLYNETGYFSIVGAMHDGERKQANLRVLFERSLQFENTSYKGLFNFINFVDKLKTSKGDLGSAKILGENDNVVRLMSIHKSKGLEFPVVFLSGCGKKVNFQDMYKNILLHQELGFGPDFVDHKKRIKYPSVPKMAIAQKLKLETLSEEMRILYVALTRAREKLILTGAVNNIEKSSLKWLALAASVKEAFEKFSAYNMLKAQNYLDWLCPAIMRHKNAGKLCQAAGEGIKLEGQIEDDSIWDIFLWSNDIAGKVFSNNISENENKQSGADIDRIEAQNQSNITEWINNKGLVDAKKVEEINRRLNWKYKYDKFIDIPSKISVTEIKRYFNINNEGEDSYILNKKVNMKKPIFLQEKKGLSAAEKGTIMHFVMQHIDFYNKDIKAQIKIMVQKELITEQQARSVNIGKIEKFINSPLGIRMISSPIINREVPFNIELSVEELFTTDSVAEREDTILLQGVVDCYFEEAGEIVLLDYKTDYIPEGHKSEIKDKYGLQIEYYSRALELLTGMRVKEKNIYMFTTGEIIQI